MVQSLFHIAQAVCMQQAGRISDVGDIPYHLLQPVLRRLNAKQLATVEENSPSLTPDSDELWAALVERDFANRPFNPKASSLASSAPFPNMPNKCLYQQYSEEREQFLASSAQRLRRITEKLQKEKTKNSIVAIPGIVADPTRRRFVSQAARNYATKNPKSILGKAKRDVSQRHLMFGRTLRVPRSQPKFPSSKNVGSRPTSLMNRPTSLTNKPTLSHRTLSMGYRESNHTNKSQDTRNDLPKPTNGHGDLPPRLHNQGIYARPPPVSPERKRPSSVFLQSKRRRESPQSPQPERSQERRSPERETSQRDTKRDSERKKTRSSVFH